MRFLLIAAGILLIAVSLLAETLGLSRGGGFPEGQILAGGLGLLTLLASLAWRRAGSLWRVLGRSMLLMLIVILGMKSLASLVRSLKTPGSQEMLLREDLVPGVDSPLVFSPHVMWSAPGFTAPLPGQRTWLYGSSDALPPGYCTSFADRRQPGYNSTQSIILLMMDLRGSDPPDTVILTAGPADARSALETGDPRFHAGYSNWMAVTGSESSLSMGLSGSDLAEAAAWTQNVNRTVLEALGREYSFQPVFLWTAETACPQDPAETEFILQVDSLLREF